MANLQIQALVPNQAAPLSVTQPKEKKGKNGFSKFPDATCSLSELKTWAKDTKKIEKLLKEIKSRTKKKDQEFKAKSKSLGKKLKKKGHHTLPWDHNHSGRVVDGVYINASDINLDVQKYIFAACPRDRKGIGDYYDVLLKRKTQVIVTVNKEGEKGDTPAFWSQKELGKVKLRDGWKIEVEKTEDIWVASKPVFTKDVKPKKMSEKEKKKWLPRIQETHLIAKHPDGKTTHKFIHLYHDNWHDHKAPPDHQGLEKLIDTMDKYATSTDLPIAINCHGGIGRTGTVGLIHYARKKINSEMAQGKSLKEIKINLPEMLYELRTHRQGMLGNKGQLPAVYKQLAAYYKRLKPK